MKFFHDFNSNFTNTVIDYIDFHIQTLYTINIVQIYFLKHKLQNKKIIYMRIAFFGGTFDPPHDGHLELARHILRIGKTDKILIVPAYDPPHKPEEKISSYEDRYEMLKMLVESEPDIVVSDIEYRAQLKPSYSYKILNLLAKRFPEDKVQLIIGGDSLVTLNTWYKAHEIVAEYEILCYPRKGFEYDENSLGLHWNEKEIDILLKSSLQMPFFDISSTSVRKQIAEHRNSKNVNKKILEYINKKGLYSRENA